MNQLGTEIRLYTTTSDLASLKVKFLEDEKGLVKRAMVAIRNDELINIDTLSLANELVINIVNNIGKKIKKANDIYKYINDNMSRSFVHDLEITHLKIHPILQTRKAGAGFTIFDDDVKETYLLEPKRRFTEMLKEEQKNKKGATKDGI